MKRNLPKKAKRRRKDILVSLEGLEISFAKFGSVSGMSLLTAGGPKKNYTNGWNSLASYPICLLHSKISKIFFKLLLSRLHHR